MTWFWVFREQSSGMQSTNRENGTVARAETKVALTAHACRHDIRVQGLTGYRTVGLIHNARRHRPPILGQRYFLVKSNPYQPTLPAMASPRLGDVPADYAVECLDPAIGYG